MASKKTICEGCGKKKAGGGMPMCYGCYGIRLDLNKDEPLPKPAASSITYPLPKRKPRTN